MLDDTTLPPRPRTPRYPAKDTLARPSSPVQPSRLAPKLANLAVGLTIGVGSTLAWNGLSSLIGGVPSVAPVMAPEPAPAPSAADPEPPALTAEPPMTPPVPDEGVAPLAPRPPPKAASKPRRAPETRGAEGIEGFEARARAAGLRVQLRAAGASAGERYIAHVDWVPTASDRLAAIADPEMTARDLLGRVARHVSVQARDSRVQLASLELHNEETRFGWRMSAKCMTKVASAAAGGPGKGSDGADAFDCVESVDFP